MAARICGSLTTVTRTTRPFARASPESAHTTTTAIAAAESPLARVIETSKLRGVNASRLSGVASTAIVRQENVPMPSQLVSLIRGDAPIAEIAAALDAMPGSARRDEVNGLGRKDQARLFDKAEDAPPITLAHFVPDAIDALTPVHHPGRNTILTLPHFQRFEKRFTRPRGDSSRLFGYNASNAWFITPGYFVAYETAGNAEWERRGGVVVDYHQIPDAPLPRGWPVTAPNSRGLQRLVYHLTRDFMRRVSTHVSIGRASRDDGEADQILDYWFTLCRQDDISS